MRRRRAVRGALLAVVLSAGVILGLLGMHTLDGHGAGHGGAAVAAHAHVGAMADGAPAHVAAHASIGSSPHSASPARVVALVAPVTTLFALLPQPHDPAGAAGVGLTCVLALFAGLLLLTLPRSGLPLSGTPQATAPPLRRTASPARPVSLHELCISRR